MRRPPYQAAANALHAKEKLELMLLVAARLRAVGAMMPEPRKFTSEEIASWLAEDRGRHADAQWSLVSLMLDTAGWTRLNP